MPGKRSRYEGGPATSSSLYVGGGVCCDITNIGFNGKCLDVVGGVLWMLRSSVALLVVGDIVVAIFAVAFTVVVVVC